MNSSHESASKSESLDVVGLRAQRKQHNKKVKHAVNDVQSVLNWSDRILHGATSSGPDRRSRRAPQAKTRRPAVAVAPKPAPAVKPASSDSGSDVLRPAPAAVNVRSSVPLKPGIPLTLGAGTKPRQSSPKIILSSQTVAASATKLTEANSQSPSSSDDSAMPSYREIQRRRHQREKQIARRRVLRSVLIALTVGILLALVLQSYVWYATGSLFVAPEVIIFSALLVLGPPLLAIVIGVASLRGERWR